MAANVIRLNPNNFNEILIDDDDPNVILLTVQDGVLPDGYRPNPDSKVVGGGDTSKKVSGSGGQPGIGTRSSENL